MTTSVYVRRYINTLSDCEVFTTRDLLHLGSRASIDLALVKLVKKGGILRLARGVFQHGDESCPRPSPAEIATKKAKAFGKDLATCGDDLLVQLRLSTHDAELSSKTFWVNGYSSAFQYGDTRIVLKSVTARKMNLVKKGGPALSLVALWHLGKKKVTRLEVSISATYNSHERQHLKQSLNSVPQWLSDFYLR